MLLANEKKLEYLNLMVRKDSLFGPLNDLCEQIGSLEELCHLQLSFIGPELIPGYKPRISSFIPCLQKTLTKPIRLETLCLLCHQIDPSEAFLGLLKLLKDSADSLQKLEINFAPYSPTKADQVGIVRFIKSLEKIQKLKLPFLNIASQNFIEGITQAILPLKYLREFKIGEIQEGVTASGYCDAIVAILSKRGLRIFECQSFHSLLEKCGLPKDWEVQDLSAHQSNLLRAAIKNPSLECVDLSSDSPHLDLFDNLFTWEEFHQFP